MRTYVIIDQLGMKHGTVKANGTTEAMNIFCGKCSQSFRDMVMAIELSAMNQFIDNIKSFDMEKRTVFNDGVYYAKIQIGELTIFRKGYCNFEFRLCDVAITESQAKEYLYLRDGSVFSNTELDRMIMEK